MANVVLSTPMELRSLTIDDVDVVLAAEHLFDAAPTREWTRRFLERGGHHLVFAEEDGRALGFVSGMEISHPDKGTEMLLYELGVDEGARRRGVGRALCEALAEEARAIGCHGMWVPMSSTNTAAAATYRAAGALPAQEATIAVWEF